MLNSAPPKNCPRCRGLMIIEDDYYRFYTTRQVIETHLRLHLDVITAETKDELIAQTAAVNPTHVVFRPVGGVVEIVDYLKKLYARCLCEDPAVRPTASDIDHQC